MKTEGKNAKECVGMEMYRRSTWGPKVVFMVE